jgi:hypothetical protein
MLNRPITIGRLTIDEKSKIVNRQSKILQFFPEQMLGAGENGVPD